jgi:small GTP-binding protein
MSSSQKYEKILTNLLEADKKIKAIVVTLRNGLVIASKIRDADTDEELVAATTSVFDIFMNRVKKDFGSANDFINMMTVDANKFLFAAAGKDAILTIVANLEADDRKLKVYGGHVAKKIRSLVNHEPIDSTEIPQVIHLLANARSSSFPNGVFLKKVIFLGDARTGKSSIIRRYVENTFDTTYLPTIGMQISEKTLQMNKDCQLDLKFWEMESQSHMMSPLRKRFYSNSKLVFVIFDLTRRQTFTNLIKWINIFSKNFHENVPIIILGNKSDLPDHEVSQEDIKQLQKEMNTIIFSVSAKTNENIEDAFKFAAHKIFNVL